MNIFVGHLAPMVTADDLRATFSRYGTVINAIVMRDTLSHQPLGYGHVYLVPEEAARQAIADLNRFVLRGRPVVVRECVDRTRKERRVNTLPWKGTERRRNSERRLNGREATAPRLAATPARDARPQQPPATRPRG